MTLPFFKRLSYQITNSCKYRLTTCYQAPSLLQTSPFTTTSKIDDEETSTEFRLPDNDNYNEIMKEIKEVGPNSGDNTVNENAFRFIQSCYQHPDNNNRTTANDLEYAISFLHDIIHKHDDNNVRSMALISKITSAKRLQNVSIFNQAMDEVGQYSSEWSCDDLIQFGNICALSGHLDKMMDLQIKLKDKHGAKGLERRQEIEQYLQDNGLDDAYWLYQDYWNVLSLCLKFGLHHLPNNHQNVFGTKEMETEMVKIKLKNIDVGDGNAEDAVYKQAIWDRTVARYGGKIDWYDVEGVDRVIKEDGMCVINGSVENEKTCIGPWFDDRIVVLGKNEHEEEEWHLQRDDQDEKLFVGSFRIGKVPEEGPKVDYMFDCKLQLK